MVKLELDLKCATESAHENSNESNWKHYINAKLNVIDFDDQAICSDTIAWWENTLYRMR